MSDDLRARLRNAGQDTEQLDKLSSFFDEISDLTITPATEEAIAELIESQPTAWLWLDDLVRGIRSASQDRYLAEQALQVRIEDIARGRGHYVYPQDNGEMLVVSNTDPDINLTLYPDGVLEPTSDDSITNAVEFVSNFPTSSGISKDEATKRVLSTVETGTARQDRRDWVTREQIDEAKRVPIEELIGALGYETVKDGSKSLRLRDNRSVVVSNNMWHDFGATGSGGSTIDFIMRYHSPGMKLQEAVREIHRLCLRPLDIDSTLPQPPKEKAAHPEQPSEALDNEEFSLPGKNRDASQVIAYLTKTRGINYDIVVQQLREGRIYQTSPIPNCCFVGYDSQGIARNAHLRGTNSQKRFMMDVSGSSKEYSFAMPGQPDGKVYVFESPIDALSHASLFIEWGSDWQQDTRLSLNGVSSLALERYLREHPEVKEITLCLDSDDAGYAAAVSIEKKLNQAFPNVAVVCQYALKKDFNEELMHHRKVAAAQNELQAAPQDLKL